MTIDFEGWLNSRRMQLKEIQKEHYSAEISKFVGGKLDMLDEIEIFFVFSREEDQIKSGVGNNEASEESKQRDG